MRDAFPNPLVLYQNVVVLEVDAALDPLDQAVVLVHKPIPLVLAHRHVAHVDKLVRFLELRGHVGHDQKQRIDGVESQLVFLERVGPYLEHAPPAEQHRVDGRAQLAQKPRPLL